MTTRQAYTLYRTLVDEGSDVFLTPDRFLLRYAQERTEWLKAKSQQPETEYIKRITAAFKAPVLNVTDDIDAGIPLTGLGKTSFIRAVMATFEKLDYTLRDRPANPLSDDAYGENMMDPGKRPDDWFPAYKEDEGSLFIKSDTTPASVSIRYLRDLPAPTMTETTGSELAESALAIYEILNRLAGRQDLSTENASRYAALANREIPTSELNV